MITAIVFVQVKSDQIPEVAEQIAAIEGVSEVYSVTGSIDLIVMVRVRDFETVADVLALREQIRQASNAAEQAVSTLSDVGAVLAFTW